jgi:hypothetical protein
MGLMQRLVYLIVTVGGWLLRTGLFVVAVVLGIVLAEILVEHGGGGDK